MKCRIFDVVRELVGVGVIVGLGIGTAPANAAIETLEFSGYFLSGSVAPFPLFPATISGMVVYDTTNSGVVTPYNYTFVNSDLTVGSSAWYYNSITKFVFRSVNAELGSQITGCTLLLERECLPYTVIIADWTHWHPALSPVAA